MTPPSAFSDTTSTIQVSNLGTRLNALTDRLGLARVGWLPADERRALVETLLILLDRLEAIEQRLTLAEPASTTHG